MNEPRRPARRIEEGSEMIRSSRTTKTGIARLLAGFAIAVFALAGAGLARPALAGHHEDEASHEDHGKPAAKPGKPQPSATGASCSDCAHCAKHTKGDHECTNESCPLHHGDAGHHGHHGMGHGLDAGQPPSAEQRAKMAEHHERLAACLRSTRPIGECHAEMKRHHGGAKRGGEPATAPAKPEKGSKPEKSDKRAQTTD